MMTTMMMATMMMDDDNDDDDDDDFYFLRVITLSKLMVIFHRAIQRVSKTMLGPKHMYTMQS